MDASRNIFATVSTGRLSHYLGIIILIAYGSDMTGFSSTLLLVRSVQAHTHGHSQSVFPYGLAELTLCVFSEPVVKTLVYTCSVLVHSMKSQSAGT